jgi:hypothetical protein
MAAGFFGVGGLFMKSGHVTFGLGLVLFANLPLRAVVLRLVEWDTVASVAEHEALERQREAPPQPKGGGSAAVLPAPADAGLDGDDVPSAAAVTTREYCLRPWAKIKAWRQEYRALFGFGGRYFPKRLGFSEGIEILTQLVIGLNTASQTLITYGLFLPFVAVLSTNIAVSPTLLALGWYDEVVILDAVLDSSFVAFNLASLFTQVFLHSGGARTHESR